MKDKLVLNMVRNKTGLHFFSFKTKLIGMGVRDSCGKSESRGDPRGAKSAEGGPPAESECLKWKSTL
ncbi:hypothetical protein RCO48_24645 [Peribacillus frigoritolerans]|nr:hypothetical protein [Peribacillus frigoritolerans]